MAVDESYLVRAALRVLLEEAPSRDHVRRSGIRFARRVDCEGEEFGSLLDFLNTGVRSDHSALTVVATW